MKTYQSDHQLMHILGTTQVSRLICTTPLGSLHLSLRKGSTEYFFTLDSVELSKEKNKELFELLYPLSTPQEDKPSEELIRLRALEQRLIDGQQKNVSSTEQKPKHKGGRPKKITPPTL